MERKTPRVLALLFIGLFICRSALPAGGQTPYDKGLLWRIEGLGAEPDYVYGTIHIEDPRVLDLPRAVSEAFGATDRLVMELEPDAATLGELGAAMTYPDGQNLKAALGGDLYRRATAALAERGVPEAIARNMRPWAVLIALNTPKAQTGLAMDIVLYLQAMQEGKRVQGLESAAEQVAVFADMPADVQVRLLRDTVESLDQLDKVYQTLVQAYLKEDLAGMQVLNDDAMAISDAATQALVRKRLITDRNHRMVERMLPWLRESSAFVAVGALHLTGPEGILQLLSDRGYRVTRVR
jgi:uncharacterized protein YbaP (TraB family)